jgi:integrase
MNRRAKGTGTIFKRGEKYYYKNPKKNITAISLGTTNKNEALEIVKEKYSFADLENEKTRLEKLLNQYDKTKEKLELEKQSKIKLSDILTEYQKAIITARRADGKDTQLKQSTKVIVNNFINWINPINLIDNIKQGKTETETEFQNRVKKIQDRIAKYKNIKTMDQITNEIVQDYFINKECKPSSYNRYLAELKVVWKRINERYGNEFNPFDAIIKIKTSVVKSKTSSKRPFTPDELKIISEKATGWIKLAVIIGYYSGLRLSDVVCLETKSISDGYISTINRKTNKFQVIYCPEIVPAVEQWQAKQGKTKFIFQEQAETYLGLRDYSINARTKNKIRKIKPNPTKASKLFSKFLVNECGFKTTNSKNDTVLGFHSLRVSNATYSARAGIATEQIQNNLNHSNQAITNGYIQLTEKEIKQDLKASYIALPAINQADIVIEPERQQLKQLIDELPIDRVKELLCSLK